MLQLLASSILTIQISVPRDVNRQVLLQSGPIVGTQYGWGPATRKADHATVAKNSLRQIAVAYHTDRSDIGAPFNLKQVEVALYTFDQLTDSWTHVATELVGSVEYSPLDPPYLQDVVKCERPDVIAVGDRFFVTWTRIYDRTTKEEEPAQLECAWISWDAVLQRFIVHASGTTGLGYFLDKDLYDHDGDFGLVTPPTRLFVRECSGVPDAVVLRENLSGVSTVGVAYPHQSDFGDWPTADATRLCELRFVTCTFDGSNLSRNVPRVMVANVPFDGDTGPSGGSGTSAGLYLPDLARGSSDGRFIHAYEEQYYFDPPTNTIVNGVIRFQIWQYDFATQALPMFAITTQTIGGTGSPLKRRRPNLHSRPVPGATVDEQWQHSESGTYRVPWPIGEGWHNPAPPATTYNDFRPVPLHGQAGPFLRRCYAERDLGTGICQILEYEVDGDPDNNDTPLVLAQGPDLGRPAVGYRFEAGAPLPQYAAVTWEAPGSVQSNLKIWLRVRT